MNCLSYLQMKLDNSAALLRRTLAAGLMLILLSCSESIPPYLMYRADFEPSMTVEVEKYVRDTASAWDLIIWESPLEAMSARDADSFSIFLYFDEESFRRNRAVLWINNSLVAESVSMMFFDLDRMPVADLDALASELKQGMEQRFGLQFCRVDPAISECMEEGAIAGSQEATF